MTRRDVRLSLSSSSRLTNANKIQQTSDLVRDFFSDENNHHATVVDESTLQVILTSDKLCSHRLPGAQDYLDDHGTKLDLVPRVRRNLATAISMPGFDQAALWAALWLMPTENLQELHDNLRQPASKADLMRLQCQLVVGVSQIPKFIRIFRGQDPDTLNEDDSNAPKAYNAGDKRNRGEADLALERDSHKCVITDTLHPQVCHIFPFASLKYRYQKVLPICLDGMKKIWGIERVDDLSEKLMIHGPNETAAIDTVTNMICLSPQLHDWWLRGYFALEPIRLWSEPLHDSTPDRPDRAAKKRKIPEKWSIQIRFDWLRKIDVPMLTSKVKFSDDPITMMQEPAGEGLVRAFNATTCRQVENGQIFTMTADSRDRLPDYDILLLQWDLLRMWRLAGGADPTVYPLDDDFLDSSDDEV
ncbi:Putative HNH nuclease [Colletotrichum destructivum]|uniref:HNH nuclease n=1 Tax=Colletotrichum destructivum TaxID=34406 RepID=A0AAX4IX55_9PEZI|nr:Putative HNH nuclease [Colletotrichum destructivum]